MFSSSLRPSFLAPFVLAAGLAACSSSSSTPGRGNGATNPPTPGAVGDLCSATSPCASGLTCAASGDLLGRCTADCSANLDLCATKFGADTVCMNASQCARTCTSAAQCPGGGTCAQLTGGISACTANANGTGAPTPPNGACANVGGPFGDTVANGGYRCAVSSTGTLGTGIEQCKNGTWVAAYTCSCQVTFGGASDPSQCFDITAAGTAQCSYGMSSCAECDPSTGCHSP